MEVTAALTIRKNDDIPKVTQTLAALNRSGILGSKTWIASYWGSEGKYVNIQRCLFVPKKTLGEFGVNLD